MKKKNICVFLFDGYSDWEISYFAPEINKSGRFDIIYFSGNGASVHSMGGLCVTPTKSLADLDMNAVDMLVLPGGAAWEKGLNREVEKLTAELFAKGKPIAAICAATTFLAQMGLLDDLKHTSNDLDYPKSVAPAYRGTENYRNALAVTDKNIITANGIAPVEFAREIFALIGLYDTDALENWFQLFKNGIWNG